MTVPPTPLPENRAPAKPGEIIMEEFLKPLNMTKQQLANAMHISRDRLEDIVNGRAAIDPDIAQRLEMVLGPSAQFWLHVQSTVESVENPT